MNETYLWEKLGPLVRQGLLDNYVYEVMLNPDGKLWFMHHDEGNVCVGDMLKSQSSAFVHALAQHEKKYFYDRLPYLDSRLYVKGDQRAI